MANVRCFKNVQMSRFRKHNPQTFKEFYTFINMSIYCFVLYSIFTCIVDYYLFSVGNKCYLTLLEYSSWVYSTSLGMSTFRFFVNEHFVFFCPIEIFVISFRFRFWIQRKAKIRLMFINKKFVFISKRFYFPFDQFLTFYTFLFRFNIKKIGFLSFILEELVLSLTSLVRFQSHRMVV